MRILWVCNVVLPEFSDEFHIKHTVFGGWMSGMLRELEYVDDVEIALAFPIRDAARRHDGVCCGHRYYAFNASRDIMGQDDEDCVDMIADFQHILSDCRPDVVHLWGTEYPHSWAMMKACEAMGMAHRTVCHIQGILTYIKEHYALGLPSLLLSKLDDNGRGIAEEIASFDRQSFREREVMRSAGFVMGRTFWDESCARQICPDVKYRFCEEILREPFYQNKAFWDTSQCHRHTIFVSQAGYPVKGFHFLLRAIRILKDEYPDLTVYVGGGDPMTVDKSGNISIYGRYLKSLGEKYGALKYIHFTGLLDAAQMIEQYRNANAFVSTSTIENSPNSIAEAMMIGTPVVASCVGGVPELLHHLNDGILYPCDEAYMIAAWVRRIFEDDDLARNLSSAARMYANQRHDKKSITKQLLNVYKEACEQEA